MNTSTSIGMPTARCTRIRTRTTGNTCTITEVAPTPIAGYTWAAVTYDPQSVLIGEKDGTFTVKAVNSILKDRGTLKIMKSLSNPDGAAVPTSFTAVLSRRS